MRVRACVCTTYCTCKSRIKSDQQTDGHTETETELERKRAETERERESRDGDVAETEYPSEEEQVLTKLMDINKSWLSERRDHQSLLLRESINLHISPTPTKKRRRKTPKPAQ